MKKFTYFKCDIQNTISTHFIKGSLDILKECKSGVCTLLSKLLQDTERELAKLRKDEKDDEEKDDTKFLKLHMSRVLEVRKTLLAICIVRYQFVSNFW